MSNRHFVLDTKVIVSTLMFPHSKPQRALDKVLLLGKLLQSTVTLAELIDVLERKKFDKYLPAAERARFLDKLTQEMVLIPVTVTITDCRDPKDNKFLELAASGSAECIISGDVDLLVLHPFRKINIITPAAFVEQGDI